MDINDDLVPPEAGLDSLESEIDALSKIIDTKDGAQKLDDFKLDSDVVFNESSLDSTVDNKCESNADEILAFKDILFTENPIPTSSEDNEVPEDNESPIPKINEQDTTNSPKLQENSDEASKNLESINPESGSDNVLEAESHANIYQKNLIDQVDDLKSVPEPNPTEPLIENQQVLEEAYDASSRCETETSLKNLPQIGEKFKDLEVEKISQNKQSNNDVVETVDRLGQNEFFDNMVENVLEQTKENINRIETEELISESIGSTDYVNKSSFENKSVHNETDKLKDNVNFLSNESDNLNITIETETENLNPVECVDEEKSTETVQEMEIKQSTDSSYCTVETKSPLENLENQETENSLKSPIQLQDEIVLNPTIPHVKLIRNLETLEDELENKSTECLEDISCENSSKVIQNTELSSETEVEVKSKIFFNSNEEIVVNSEKLQPSETKTDVNKKSIVEERKDDIKLLNQGNNETVNENSTLLESSNELVENFSEFNECDNVDKQVTIESYSAENLEEITNKSKDMINEKPNTPEQIDLAFEQSEITEKIEEDLFEEKTASLEKISEEVTDDYEDTKKNDLLDPQDDSLNKLAGERIDSSKIFENMDINKGENMEQESCSSKETENKSNSIETNLLEPESSFDNLTELEFTDSINKETVSFNKESSDSLLAADNFVSEQIFGEEKENFDLTSTEREDDISLAFEESSQSPKKVESNKLESDFHEGNDTAQGKEAAEENVKENVNCETLEMPLELEKNEQLEHIEDCLDQETSKKPESESSTEVSELESAVKFLQKSEEQDIEILPAVEIPISIEKTSNIFVALEDTECATSFEPISELTETSFDPITISEAEIISEAAKLESERIEKLEQQNPSNDTELTDTFPTEHDDQQSKTSTNELSEVPCTSEGELSTPPKILITTEKSSEVMELNKNLKLSLKQSDSSTTSKSNLQSQKNIQQRYESPDRQITNEPKITDTPKKDNSDKQQHLECENVGSPRIILKIAKSAITECSEPRSPKSPKIRSATNSPNPDDASGQKLNKIKLKLSRSGHPSIISSTSDRNEESTAQWHTDNTSSEKPLGMKIKLTKTTESDAKHDELHKQEDVKDKSVPKGEECRKTEALKIKLSKTGDASIVQQDNKEVTQENPSTKKQESPPIGMKIKLSKTGDATIIQQDSKSLIEDVENVQESSKRCETAIGMKIKLSKSGDASVISNEPLESTKEAIEIEESTKRTDSPIGVKIKLAKTGDGSASILTSETIIESKERSGTDILESQESVKGKVSKMSSESEVSVMPDEGVKSTLGMKFKLSKTGDASVIHPKKEETPSDAPAIGMKIKLSKTGEPSIIHPDHGSTSQQKTKDDTHLEMKIKLSKTGHPTIISQSNESLEDSLKVPSISASQSLKHKDLLSFKESTLKVLKKSHSEVNIESAKEQTVESTVSDMHNKRKEITIAPIEAKKQKLDQMLPDTSIETVTLPSKDQHRQKLHLETNSGNISQQQMNVINEEISITQISSITSSGPLREDHHKALMNAKNEQSSPLNSDCEIIEPHPEFIIVNENSNSSQDVMIIDEVPTLPAVKVPKKRGRPRRNAIPAGAVHTVTDGFNDLDPLKDPLSLDHASTQPGGSVQDPSASGEGSERPRRTCRSQKSYAPPKRGRGRGRGKRKDDSTDIPAKKPRVDQDLSAIEKSTTAVLTLKKLPLGTPCTITNSPELFKALNQPTAERPGQIENTRIPEKSKHDYMEMSAEEVENRRENQDVSEEESAEEQNQAYDEEPAGSISSNSDKETIKPADESLNTSSEDIEEMTDRSDTVLIKVIENEKKPDSEVEPNEAVKDQSNQDNQNWLAPSLPKMSNDSSRSDSITALTVIDEDTRMSAESGSRSQTPARNIIVPGASEPLLNEESQSSVLSSATTESERVKVQKNRRMEINFDPDEGPFTVDKIAEYEWPRGETRAPNSRGETFMIQEQISHYLGVKSFKRKYPDLKRRMVDMEERNFLRENGLVSESMCDMGLTAVSSSEVLDIMCNDFPEQYEEYRRYLREKAAKEHSKKQKELTAAANAERNRIDLAEMAMQSALSWNANFNKTRKESRNSSLDLQTFTVQIPKRKPKIDTTKRANYYPVALLPEQYTDYYKAYTPAELRYFPLNTVIYGPMLPNERKFYTQSEISQSDSDSDSSSDDSSSSSSEGTQDTEGSQSTMDEVDMELSLQSNLKCKICSNNLNKNNRPEVLVQCGTCNGNVHPSCMDLTVDMVPHIRAYAWQCTDCKTCAQCHDPADEDKMLFCDMCDRGYHIYCVGLRRVPQGRWHCQECAVCANCGSKEPGGVNSDRNSVAQWQHEYKKAEKNTRVYVSTFCVPCSKLWRKGRYCPHCSRCHNASRLDQEPNLVHCGACDKYLHLGCVEAKELIIDKRHYLCEFCSPNRQQFVKPLMSKTFKT